MWYLKSAFDTYEKLQNAVQNRLSEVQSAILSPVDIMKRFLGPGTSSRPSDQDSEVELLRKRIGELETQLAQRPRQKRQPRKKH